MMKRIILVLDSFSALCHTVGVIFFIPGMAVIVTLNVLFRYFFNSPLEWGEEINGLMLFLVLFLSMTYTWDQKKHIRMELLYAGFRGVLRSLADVLAGICGIIFFGFLSVQCFRDIPYMIRTSEASETLLIPLWPFRVLIIIISFVFVIKLIIYIFHGRKAKERYLIEREGVVVFKEGEK